MNIGIATIYGDIYAKDRLFDISTCIIGENLLIPGIKLREELERKGHSFHTIDMLKNKIDRVIFQDIGPNYIIVQNSPIKIAKYILKRKWRFDNYLLAGTHLDQSQRILIMQEPPVVNPYSYNPQFHSYFGKILTWDDDLVDNKRYFKFFYPQVLPEKQYYVPFSEKRSITMICGNKVSDHPKELYSERRKVIEYFENSTEDFDLYGFGWENEKLKNYRGKIDKKLETLSHYKFSICFENMCDVKGYITEKIFDCFFAGVVPIYWGADNILDFIPKESFVDYRNYSNIEELLHYLQNISQKEYKKYIDTAQEYIHSNDFEKYFSVDSYIMRIVSMIEK